MEEKKRVLIGGYGGMGASGMSEEDMLRAIQKKNAKYADIVKEVAEEEELTDEQIYEAFEKLDELGIEEIEIQKVKTATKKKKDKSKTKARRKQAKKSKQRNR